MSAPPQTRCPYCKGRTPAGAVKCLHCGEWFDKRKQTSSQSAKLLFLFFVLACVAAYAMAVANVR